MLAGHKQAVNRVRGREVGRAMMRASARRSMMAIGRALGDGDPWRAR
jgi:chromosomal replication initiation ATPase DnaA